MKPARDSGGQFAASLDEVKANMAACGSPGVCDYKVGYFDESLKDFDRQVAMAFLDVDLIDSLTPCLQAIWPHLDEGGRVYVHEAEDLTLVGVFFYRAWWRDELDQAPPAFYRGAGAGLPLVALRGYLRSRLRRKDRHGRRHWLSSAAARWMRSRCRFDGYPERL